jgi:diguanylate cyclase (GGDEF)-like protein
MTSLPTSLRHSTTVLRRLLLTYWVGSVLLIGAGLTVIDLLEQRQQMVREGEQIAHMVSSALRTPMTTRQRQVMLEAYGQTNRLHRVEGLNVLMVIDASGHIAYSSRPAWRTLLVSDPLLDQVAGDDPDFRGVVECFRSKQGDCMQIRSVDWHVHLSGFTVIRPVSMPARDLGLPRQPYLVLVNFDAGMLISDVLQDVPTLLLLAVLISTLLWAGLWLSLSRGLLPQLVEATQTDALTQLINRTSFMEQAMDLLADAEERRADLVFAILDIDHFKRINDTYGHGCGDAALSSVGALLLTVTRPDDLVCRFGGEEFALLLSASRDAGNKALERLRLQLEMNRLNYNGHHIPLTVSIGAAATSDCGYNIDFLYNASDKALYAAKHGGRNRLEWNTGELISRLPSAAALRP